MKDWLKKLLSESSGASFGRLSSAVVIFFGLLWGSYIVIKRLEIPSLQGLAALAASLYGGSKIGETLQKFAGTDKSSGDSKPSPKPDNPDA